MGNPRFELMRHDVTFPLYVEIDEIYSLACPASPFHYQSDPIQTVKINVLGAINMLDLANDQKQRFCRPLPVRFMVILKCILSMKVIGEM